MALTLRVWFGFGSFGFSFLEWGGFGSSGVGFSFERTAGTMGEFVLRGHPQSWTVFGAPARGVLGLRGPEEDVEGGPSALEAPAAWGFGNQCGGVAAELRHQVGGHQRGPQFLVKQLDAAGLDAFGVQHHFVRCSAPL